MGEQGSCSIARIAAKPAELRLPQLAGVRGMVARRTAHMRLQWLDREEIVSAVMERMVKALARRGGVGAKALGAATAENVDWAIADFCRAGMRRMGREQLTAPQEIPEPCTQEPPSAAEQADCLASLLRPLKEREREMLFERYVLELDAGEVAARHRMRPEAVTMACTRATRKARAAARRSDVAFQASPSIHTDEGQKDPEGATQVAGVPASRARTRTGPGGSRSQQAGVPRGASDER